MPNWIFSLTPTFRWETPKGLCPKAQGCCTRLPWDGELRCVPTPTGLWPLWLKDDEQRRGTGLI